jgi:succinate-semialdehyde dehydrogenase/glutarate-semialdehyde dehydrogenase
LPRQRFEVLRRAHKLLLPDTEGLTELIAVENGQSLADAAGDVGYVGKFDRRFSEEPQPGGG